MQTLFGLQIQYLAVGLTAALLILILAIAIIAVRNRFLIKLSLRNIPAPSHTERPHYRRIDALINHRRSIPRDWRHNDGKHSQCSS